MIFADFHIHSKYSKATSKLMDLKNLNLAAQLKGINLIGTGDFSHPEFFSELKENLIEFNDGIYVLKNESKTKFILTTEFSLIFEKNKKIRKIHILLFAKNFEIAELINYEFSKIGNLKADGRPTFWINAVDFMDKILDIDKEIFVVPAHIWTPWFGIFGSKSGFDTIEECFEDRSRYIYALETGLSSDPAMNWRLSKLDKYTLISNSDSHSLQNIGRENNAFNIDEEKISYNEIINAIKSKDKKKFLFTVEVPPEFGKYHYTGHRNCNFSVSPKEAIKLKNICPVCKRQLTIGVEQRVEELADRDYGFVPENAIPFKKIIPLNEICEYFKVKKKIKEFIKKFGNELNILLNVPIDELKKVDENVSYVIDLLRKNKNIVKPGYDGVYGEINLEMNLEINNKIKKGQTTLEI
ncbi:MAG: endonuclease Q family protein [Candidatus Altarchaeaceae archaeon]